MSFSRSKRFSQSFNESLPGPAHYYVNWGSIGYLQLSPSKLPRLTDTYKKTTKTSPKSMQYRGKIPQLKRNAGPKLPRKVAAPEPSSEWIGDAKTIDKVLGQYKEQKENQIPGLHPNVTIREKNRKRIDQAPKKIEKEPLIEQAANKVDQSPTSKSPKISSADDNVHIVHKSPVDAKSLHVVLPVRRKFFRGKTVKELLTDFYENPNNNSDDESSEIRLSENSYEIRINDEDSRINEDDNKENVTKGSTNIMERQFRDLRTDCDDEVKELLSLCIKETDFLKKIEMIQQLSDLQRRENEKTILNLSEIVEEGHLIFNNTL